MPVMELNIIKKLSLHTQTNSLQFRRSRYLFFVIGIFMLGYCSFVLLDAKFYQSHQARQFQQALEKSRQSAGNGEKNYRSLLPAEAETSSSRIKNPEIVISEGTPLGRIEIRAIGLAAMIVEGIDDKTLQRAVGHFPDNAMPGQQGNVALAGHRDTFFRALRNIHHNDEIILTTLKGTYYYRVISTKVVDPEKVEVLDNTGDDILTLVTCYPFDFVGHAPRRFIVRAHLLSSLDHHKYQTDLISN
jgi:sortase A